MPIYANENGLLYELDSLYHNDSGLICEAETIQSNEDGLLYEIHSSVPRRLKWYLYDETETDAGNRTSITCYDDNGKFLLLTAGVQSNGIRSVVREVRSEIFRVGSAGARVGIWAQGRNVSNGLTSYAWVELVKVNDSGTESVVSSLKMRDADSSTSQLDYTEGFKTALNISGGKYYFRAMADIEDDPYISFIYLRIAFGKKATGQQIPLPLAWTNGDNISSGYSFVRVTVDTPTVATIKLKAAAHGYSVPNGYAGSAEARCSIALSQENTTLEVSADCDASYGEVNTLTISLLLIPDSVYTITLVAAPTDPATASASLEEFEETIL